MDIEWTEAALSDMAGVDKSVSLRIKRSLERLAETGSGDVERLQGIHPPEFRLRVGDWPVRFQHHGRTLTIVRVLNRREAYR